MFVMMYVGFAATAVGVLAVIWLSVSKTRQYVKNKKLTEMYLQEKTLMLEEFRVQAVKRGCMVYNPKTDTFDWVGEVE